MKILDKNDQGKEVVTKEANEAFKRLYGVNAQKNSDGTISVYGPKNKSDGTPNNFTTGKYEERYNKALEDQLPSNGRIIVVDKRDVHEAAKHVGKINPQSEHATDYAEHVRDKLRHEVDRAVQAFGKEGKEK